MHKNLTKYSDDELVILLRSDKKASEAAFMEIYDRYALRVNAYCKAILHQRELSEDIFQETFLRFYENVRTNNNSGTLIGYLITIARNLCLNHKRDKKHTIPIEEIDFQFAINSNDIERQELSDLLMMALELLDNDSKEVLVMRVFNDLAYEEISEIIGITAARARYLVFKAKSKLKNILMPYYEDLME